MRIILLISLFLLNANAEHDELGIMSSHSIEHYNQSVFEAITNTLEHINDYEEDLCDNFEKPQKYFTNCSPEEQYDIQKRQLEAMDIIEGWLGKINEYDQALNPEQKKKAKTNFPETVKQLKCIAKKMRTAKFRCRSRKGSCSKGAFAYTWPLVNTDIHLCEPGFYRNERHQTSYIIHEVAHKCGATDVAYFNNPSTPPKNTWGQHWSNIADTFEYWYQYGFCIPNVDC